MSYNTNHCKISSFLLEVYTPHNKWDYGSTGSTYVTLSKHYIPGSHFLSTRNTNQISVPVRYLGGRPRLTVSIMWKEKTESDNYKRT